MKINKNLFIFTTMNNAEFKNLDLAREIKLFYDDKKSWLARQNIVMLNACRNSTLFEQPVILKGSKLIGINCLSALSGIGIETLGDLIVFLDVGLAIVSEKNLKKICQESYSRSIPDEIRKCYRKTYWHIQRYNKFCKHKPEIIETIRAVEKKFQVELLRKDIK